MKEILRPLAVTAALSLAACGESSTATQEQSPLPSPSECVDEYFDTELQLEFQESAKKFLDQAVMLARSARDQEATDVADFIEVSVTFTAPEKDEVPLIVLEKYRTYDCEYLTFISQAQAFGQYNEDADAVLLNVEPGQGASDLWGGLITLHEFRHAYSDSLGQTSPLEERDTRVFEQRIISSIGGEPYRQVLELIKQELIDGGFNEKDDFLLAGILDIDMQNQQLDEIFGASQSDLDMRLRNSAIYTHAVFELIEATAESQGFDIAQAQEDVMSAFRNSGETPG